MKYLFSLFLLYFSLNLIAQTKYEKGYYVDSNGTNVECLIRNDIWRYNPEEFSYRMNEGEPPVTMTSGSVRQFGLHEGNHFISTEVMIDISSDDFKNLSDREKPEWMKQRVFLSVMVEGKATLYSFKTPMTLRFFYSKEDQPLQQFVFRNYLSGREVKTDLYFRQQLWNNINFTSLTAERLNKTEYSENSLEKFFIDYNHAAGNVKVYKKKKDGGAFHIAVTPGLALTTIKVFQTSSYNIDKGSYPRLFWSTKATIRAGIFLEYVFPYTNKKVSLILEPTYRSFHGNYAIQGSNIIAKINLIEVPVGFRYYAFLNQNFKVFGNVSVTFPFMTRSPGSNIYYEGYKSAYLQQRISFSLGGGMMWKRFSGELRYNHNRKMYTQHGLLTKFSSWEFVAGVRIF